MGRRGPPPTPTPVLKLRGSWRAKAREKEGAEPTPDRGLPIEPAHLSEDEQKVWAELCDMLDRMQLLFVADGWQIERYAVFFTRWRRVESVIRRFGGTDTLMASAFSRDESRMILKSAMAESRSLDAQMKQIENSFGLNPSARTRIRLMDRLGDAAAKEASGQSKKRFFTA
ncbi:MAG: P27 family phage terminase small subunit [Planctomycetales bacterium]